MELNQAALNTLQKVFNTAWKAGIEAPSVPDMSFLIQDFPSTSLTNGYPWLDMIPGFREWVGDRQFNDVMTRLFEVTNRDFEDSVSVPSNAIEDDQFGIYSTLVQAMGAAWPYLKYQLAVEVLTGNPKAFDDKTIFNTAHSAMYNGSLSNKVTDALSRTTFEAAYTAASAWAYSAKSKGEATPTRTRFSHLIHGPALRSTAFEIVDADKYTDGDGNLVPNANYKRAVRVEMDELTGTYANYWFLVDGSKPIKPIARQVRKEAAPFMDTTLATVERNGRFDVLASGRAAAAPTFPHLIYAGIVAAG